MEISQGRPPVCLSPRESFSCEYACCWVNIGTRSKTTKLDWTERWGGEAKVGYGHVLLYRGAVVVCEKCKCCGIHIFGSTRGILRGEGVRRRSNELQPVYRQQRKVQNQGAMNT